MVQGTSNCQLANLPLVHPIPTRSPNVIYGNGYKAEETKISVKSLKSKLDISEPCVS